MARLRTKRAELDAKIASVDQLIIDLGVAYRDFEAAKTESKKKRFKHFAESEAKRLAEHGSADVDHLEAMELKKEKSEAAEGIFFGRTPRTRDNGVWASPWPERVDAHGKPFAPVRKVLPPAKVKNDGSDASRAYLKKALSIDGYIHATYLIGRQRLGQEPLDRIAEMAQERAANGELPFQLDSRYANLVFDAEVAERGYQPPDGYVPIEALPQAGSDAAASAASAEQSSPVNESLQDFAGRFAASVRAGPDCV